MFYFLLATAVSQPNSAGTTEVLNDNMAPAVAADAGVITRKQAGIWIPIIMAIISVAAVYALYAIDDIKNRDTILYAKFLANLKDRWTRCYITRSKTNLF